MRTLRPYALASVVLAAFSVGMTSDLPAGETPGVARISDSSNAAAEPNPLPVTTVSSTSSAYDNGAAGCPNGTVGAGRGYPEEYMNHRWCRPGVYRQRMRWDYVRGPAIHPIVREPVGYDRWLPEVWYGDPRYGVPEGYPIAPMVYMPTDTTQLGYYYQRVPTWIPKPQMIPPYPLPSNFHRIDRPATLTGPCPVNTDSHGLFHRWFSRGSSCNNPQCGCRNCKCGGNCGCRTESWSMPNTPTPAQPTPADTDPGLPPKPKA